MNRKFTWVVTPLFLAYLHLAEAQQPVKVPRIGYVSGSGDPSKPSGNVEVFRQGLRDLGYVDGKNIRFEYRSAAGNLDRVPTLVAQLLELNVNVLVGSNLRSIRTAKAQTKIIPIVMIVTFDPVAAGLVDSFARPGGNITGIATLRRELGGKRLELLKELIPGMSQVGLIWDANAPPQFVGIKEYEAAAVALKIRIQSLEVRGPDPNLESAFQAAIRQRANAIIMITNPVLTRYAKRIVEFALNNRLPSMYERLDYVEAGGLVSYAANDTESYRRAAVYVDKILKGAKPGELPVEQPTKFELAINLKTAKQIGLTIPPHVLARADRVIRWM
jgi:putative ABC transport system substrate-binding protein